MLACMGIFYMACYFVPYACMSVLNSLLVCLYCMHGYNIGIARESREQQGGNADGARVLGILCSVEYTGIG